MQEKKFLEQLPDLQRDVYLVISGKADRDRRNQGYTFEEGSRIFKIPESKVSDLYDVAVRKLDNLGAFD